MKSEKFRFHLFLATLKMALVAYTLWNKNATFTEKYFWQSSFILQFKLQNTQRKPQNQDGLKLFVFNHRCFPTFKHGTWFR